MAERIEQVEILMTLRDEHGRKRIRRIGSDDWPLRGVQIEECPIAVQVQGAFRSERVGKVVSVTAKWSEYP